MDKIWIKKDMDGPMSYWSQYGPPDLPTMYLCRLLGTTYICKVHTKKWCEINSEGKFSFLFDIDLLE